MDKKRKKIREGVKDVIADVADGKLDENHAVEQIMQIMDEYADELLNAY